MIVQTPGICSGQPRIAGTRIKVKHVYTWVEQMQMTPAQVVAEYPHLNLDQIHAALAYYSSHVDEIQQDIANEEKLVAELRAKSRPSRYDDSPWTDAEMDALAVEVDAMLADDMAIEDEFPNRRITRT